MPHAFSDCFLVSNFHKKIHLTLSHSSVDLQYQKMFHCYIINFHKYYKQLQQKLTMQHNFTLSHYFIFQRMAFCGLLKSQNDQQTISTNTSNNRKNELQNVI